MISPIYIFGTTHCCWESDIFFITTFFPPTSFIQLTMALRLSAKRVTAALKAGKVSPAINGYMKRNASQATASATNVRDESKHNIHVCHDVPVISSLLTRILEPDQYIASRSFTKFSNSTTHRRTSSIYGCHIRPTTTNVCERIRMLSLGCGKQEIFGFHGGYSSQCSRTLRSRNREDNVGTGKLCHSFSHE